MSCLENQLVLGRSQTVLLLVGGRSTQPGWLGRGAAMIAAFLWILGRPIISTERSREVEGRVFSGILPLYVIFVDRLTLKRRPSEVN